VLLALRPFGILTVSGSVVSGSTVTASAAGSFASNGHSISRYDWSIVDATGAMPIVTAPSQMQTTVQITGGSQFTLRLTITDEAGTQDTTDVALSTPPPTQQPAVTTPASKGGGGGGQLGWELVLGVALLMGRRMKNGVSGVRCRSV
jgi:hypothetical protein